MQIVNHEPGAMSRRARVYIIAGGSRHLLIGLTIIFGPWLYSSAAFIPIFNLINAQIWAWIMVTVGAVCLAGAITKQVDVARAGMVGSAIVTVVLAVGLCLGLANVWIMFAQHIGWDALWHLILERPALFPADALRVIAPPSPFLPLLMLSVSIKDFTMCAQPLKVPIEDRAVRRLCRGAQEQ